MTGIDLLEGCRSWLSQQPEFERDWETGVAWFEEFLNDCERRYGVYYSGPLMAAICRAKLSVALLYHWKNATTSSRSSTDSVVSGSWVVDAVRVGKRPQQARPDDRPPRLIGGDPLHDLVVAQGVIHRSSKAFEYFHEEYRADFNRQARGFHLENLPTAEWGDLVVRLVSSRSSSLPPPLELYSGFTSLRRWLTPVIRNFLVDQRRHAASKKKAELAKSSQEATFSPIDQDLQNRIAEDSFEALLDLVAVALSHLPERSRTILRLEHIDDFSNQNIAKFLHVTEGHSSRLRGKAHIELATALEKYSHDPQFLSNRNLGLTTAELWRTLIDGLPPTFLGALIRQRQG